MVEQMDKDRIFTAPEDGTRFRVNDDGSVTNLNGKSCIEKSEAEAARNAEHAELDYLINAHPDRLKDVDAARARRAKLEKEMGIDPKKSADALAKGRERLRARIISQEISQQKQND